jgi:hypothetical protein
VGSVLLLVSGQLHFAVKSTSPARCSGAASAPQDIDRCPACHHVPTMRFITVPQATWRPRGDGQTPWSPARPSGAGTMNPYLQVGPGEGIGVAAARRQHCADSPAGCRGVRLACTHIRAARTPAGIPSCIDRMHACMHVHHDAQTTGAWQCKETAMCWQLSPTHSRQQCACCRMGSSW